MDGLFWGKTQPWQGRLIMLAYKVPLVDRERCDKGSKSVADSMADSATLLSCAAGVVRLAQFNPK
jgi:hypothetical protein